MQSLQHSPSTGHVALEPKRTFHFPTGRAACLFVGYPEPWLDALPETAVESFAGVGFPFRANVIRLGDHVLDVGSGSGTDVLSAARLVGSDGMIFALDMTPAMLNKLRGNIEQAGAGNVRVLEGNAEAIPLPDESVDVVTSNGVFNLVPNKVRAFQEVFRVLHPGGMVQMPISSCRSRSARVHAQIPSCGPNASSVRRSRRITCKCSVSGVRRCDRAVQI